MLTLYVMIAYGLMNASFKLIDLLPSAVLDWIGLAEAVRARTAASRVGGAARRRHLAGRRLADRRGASGAAAALPGAGDDSHRKTRQYTWQAMPGPRGFDERTPDLSGITPATNEGV